MPRRQWKRAVSLIAALATMAPVIAATTAHFAAAEDADASFYPECQIQANPFYTWEKGITGDQATDYIGNTGSVNRAAWTMGAPSYYSTGFFGQGVDVALIDS